MTGTTTERLRTVDSSSSSLIMIHRHTARLIVYRSFTIPASQRTLLTTSIYTRVPYICICVSFFRPGHIPCFLRNFARASRRVVPVFRLFRLHYVMFESHRSRQLAAFRQARFPIHIRFTRLRDLFFESLIFPRICMHLLLDHSVADIRNGYV